MPDTPPAEGAIIQVTQDVPAHNPKFVVDDSPLKASIVTIFSLVFFGITLFGALMRLASVGDLNAVRALLLRDDTIGWLTSVATLLAPSFWLAWRSIRSWFKKTREVEIVKAADNDVAMLKSEVAPPAELDVSPPTRARETVMPTRLVDGSVLLHRGGPLAPIAPDPQPVFTYDGGEQRPAVIAGVDVSRRDRESDEVGRAVRDAIDDGVIAGMNGIKAAVDTAPRIPGDALDAMVVPVDSNTPEFVALHTQWREDTRVGRTNMDWKEYLQSAGWSWKNKRWEPPVEEN